MERLLFLRLWNRVTERKSHKHVASGGRGKNWDGQWIRKVGALKVSGEQGAHVQKARSGGEQG